MSALSPARRVVPWAGAGLGFLLPKKERRAITAQHGGKHKVLQDHTGSTPQVAGEGLLELDLERRINTH